MSRSTSRRLRAARGETERDSRPSRTTSVRSWSELSIEQEAVVLPAEHDPSARPEHPPRLGHGRDRVLEQVEEPDGAVAVHRLVLQRQVVGPCHVKHRPGRPGPGGLDRLGIGVHAGHLQPFAPPVRRPHARRRRRHPRRWRRASAPAAGTTPPGAPLLRAVPRSVPESSWPHAATSGPPEVNPVTFPHRDRVRLGGGTVLPLNRTGRADDEVREDHRVRRGCEGLDRVLRACVRVEGDVLGPGRRRGGRR